MTPELWQRLKPLYHAALEREGDARDQFVAEACGANPELGAHLSQLLARNDAGNGPMDQPGVERSPIGNSPSARIAPGQLLLDRFRIVRLLGRGGMGEVFEAQDLQTGRVALKTIRSDIASSPQVFARFRREVQLARKVSGSQVCRIYELFLMPEGDASTATAFLTMEFLEGQTLSDKLRERGALGREEALPIALDICEGLRLIHEQGIVHRDLKTANIMLANRAGKTRAVLMDFGLAAADSSAPIAADAATLTEVPSQAEPWLFAGTPAYMAPEQFESKGVTPATDIYALGVILYELVTGHQPYAAETPMAAAIRHARRPDPVWLVQRNIPRHWDRVIRRCLEFEPESRFQNAEDVAAALKASPLQLRNLRRDHPRLLLFAGAIVLAIFAYWGAAWWRTAQYYRPGAEARGWYEGGLNALREGSYLKATNELHRALTLDPHLVMAHARLAEAWTDLDFDGAAQQEMLIASAGENRVPPLDRMYLDAIRDTLTRDFKGALGLYREILRRLPEPGKSAGYVDLGMAYERAGDPQHALESYRKSASLNSDNPASFMRAAILETHLNQVQEANSDFSRAEALYSAEENPEGEAELHFQRGYLANEREANDEANTYLNRALGEAEHLSNVQLEIRSLDQLSSVAYHSVHDDQAMALAQRAIQLAQNNGLNSWAAEGLVRVASVDLYHDYTRANEPLQEAFQILNQSPQGRVEAMANLTLASLRNLEHRPDDILQPAGSALAYYKANGHFLEAAQCSLLIARAQRDLDHPDEALQAGYQLVELSKRSGNRDLQTQAEELLGTIYLQREDYPRTLEHYQNAFTIAGEGKYKAFEATHEAEIFLRIGRYADAERMLALAPPSNPSVLTMHLQVLLGQRRYAEAETQAIQMAGSSGLSEETQRELTLDRALAEAGRGKAGSALAALRSSGFPEATTDAGAAALWNLNAGAVYLAAGDAESAFKAASSAETYYASAALKDSDLRSSLIAARAAHLRGDEANEKLFTSKAIDILKDLRNTWTPQVFLSYISRPDIQSLGSGLVRLSR